MLIDKSSAADIVNSEISKNKGTSEGARGGGIFRIECRDSEGNFKWEEEMNNLVVNQGLQDMNTKYFSGSSYTATWFLGLITGPGSGTTIIAGDTAAIHAGWTETSAYSQATRPACTFGTATTADPSVITNSASPATFSINGTVTVAGAFLISNNTKGGTTGILFSASDFSAPGDRAVVSGDTLTVTYSFSLDAV
jgi:hypothetical protein